MVMRRVSKFDLAELDARVVGGHLDLPRPGSDAEGGALQGVSWALGRERVVVAAEVRHGNTVLRRVPLGVEAMLKLGWER
jgi:hypothetical protein